MRQLKMDYLKRHTDMRSEALLEEKVALNGREYWTGYTPEYIRVLYDSDEDLSGHFVEGTLGQIEDGYMHLKN